MAQELLISFVVAIVKILSAVVLSAGALYTGISALDRLTSGMEEWKEIKKGNIAMGILAVAVMASILLLVEPRINEFVFAVDSILRSNLPASFGAELVLISLVNYLLGLFAAVLVIFVTLNVVDRLTHDLEEAKELKKGNVAVGMILAAALLLVTFATRFPMEHAFDLLLTLEKSLL